MATKMYVCIHREIQIKLICHLPFILNFVSVCVCINWQFLLVWYLFCAIKGELWFHCFCTVLRYCSTSEKAKIQVPLSF